MAQEEKFVRGLSLFDSTMIIAGAMIGSGIFIVSADIARQVGSPGWLLVVWLITSLLTLIGAVSYGELAAMMPKAGGQYVYLREAFSPMWGFLYGWTLFLVIQTGTIAAVAVGFARYLGVLWPAISDTNYIIAPLRLSSGYAVSLSTTQLVGVLIIALLTWMNTRGLKVGKLAQNIFNCHEDWRVDRAGPDRRLPNRCGGGQFRRPVDTARLFAGCGRWADCIHRIRPVRGCLRRANQFPLFSRRLEQHHFHRRRGERPAPQHSTFARARRDAGHRIVPAGQHRLSDDAPA